jgi:succinate dehydrogenase / fumarate reductase membrane anchor subunit
VSRRASGLKAWAVQRFTSVYLALFGVYLLLQFLFWPPADYAAWRGWVSQSWINLGLMLFVPALLAHAWVGTRDVLLDYVKPTGTRVGLLALVAFVFVASGLWALQALILARIV